MKLSNQKIGEFIEAYQKGVDAWVKAGEILVEMVEEDPDAFQKIVEKCPSINIGALYMFEQMGRKMLHPRLLLSDSPGYQKLATMPLSIQERYVDEPIPLVVETDNGTDILLVKAREMTKSQANQVFRNGRIGTEGEQKAWLIDRASRNAKPVGSNICAWKIKAGRVEFQSGATLSAGELATIITQLTR